MLKRHFQENYIFENSKLSDTLPQANVTGINGKEYEASFHPYFNLEGFTSLKTLFY